MTTITIALTGICSGGNHLTFGITGAKTRTVAVDLSSLSEPISDEDAEKIVTVKDAMDYVAKKK